MAGTLEEKVVLVTGGTSGIGQAVARAALEGGARVVIAARGRERGERVARDLASTGTVEFVEADMARGDAIEAMLAHVIDRFGRLDCAVNNAALAEGVLSLTAEFSEREFDDVMNVNVRGVWRCMRGQIERMLEQDPPGGAIVNVSSVNGLGGAQGGALYSASKAAVLALTKSAAQDYAGNGIRINALVAGAFETPMLNGVMSRIVGDDPEQLAAVRAEYEGLIPLRRIGAPAEAAAAAVWLCSDAASYVTGLSMIVDGGMTSRYR